MSFVLSEITTLGVIMGSDSSETVTVDGTETFHEVQKTLYFPKLNIGVSTWGDAQIKDTPINDWLISKSDEYCTNRIVSLNHELTSFTTFLAEQFDSAFALTGGNISHNFHLGVHIGGYNDRVHPGLCHVFVEPNKPNFEGQHTMPTLPPNVSGFHLRNGIYEEFAFLWPALSGIDESFRLLFQHNWQSALKPITDPVRVRSEWLGNWVKQVCLISKTAGLPEYIGKSVCVLAFDHNAKPRWFKLPEVIESDNCA